MFCSFVWFQTTEPSGDGCNPTLTHSLRRARCELPFHPCGNGIVAWSGESVVCGCAAGSSCFSLYVFCFSSSDCVSSDLSRVRVALWLVCNPQVLVFVGNRAGCDELAGSLNRVLGGTLTAPKCLAIHGDRTQQSRDDVIRQVPIPCSGCLVVPLRLSAL